MIEPWDEPNTWRPTDTLAVDWQSYVNIKAFSEEDAVRNAEWAHSQYNDHENGYSETVYKSFTQDLRELLSKP